LTDMSAGRKGVVTWGVERAVEGRGEFVDARFRMV
jgi:hypothetical protein